MYIPTYKTHIPTRIPTHAHIPTYLHTYIPTYIHTYFRQEKLGSNQVILGRTEVTPEAFEELLPPSRPGSEVYGLLDLGGFEDFAKVRVYRI